MKFTLKDVEKHWDETLEYDEINRETYSYFRRFTDGYKLSKIKDGALILDVCCRTGNGTVYFASKKKIKAVCMDVSDRMLEIAKTKLKEAKVDFTVKKLTSDALPFQDDTFDNICSFETIEHIPHPENFIYELSRVLKFKGEMILTTPNTAWEFVHEFAARTGLHHSEGPHRFIPREEILRYLTSADLIIRKEITTVLIPIGPTILLKIGEFLEKMLPELILRHVALRRIFICEKV